MQIAKHHAAEKYDLIAPMQKLRGSAYKLWVYIAEELEEGTTLSIAAIAATTGISRASAYRALEELIQTGYLQAVAPDVYDFYEEIIFSPKRQDT